jgi:hypothetical protein
MNRLARLLIAVAEPDAVPLCRRPGCNSDACHGVVKGQNGFRLSLIGADQPLARGRSIRTCCMIGRQP